MVIVRYAGGDKWKTIHVMLGDTPHFRYVGYFCDDEESCLHEYIYDFRQPKTQRLRLRDTYVALDVCVRRRIPQFTQLDWRRRIQKDLAGVEYIWLRFRDAGVSFDHVCVAIVTIEAYMGACWGVCQGTYVNMC